MKTVSIKSLGHGNFGSVMKGIYVKSNNQKLSVAIKTLKEDEIPGQRVSLLKLYKPLSLREYETNYSRVDQVNFVEDQGRLIRRNDFS